MAQRLRTDWILFLTILGMVVTGLVMLYSASAVMSEDKYGNSAYMLLRQLAWALVSFCVLMYFKKKDYRALWDPRWVYPALGGVLVLLALVFVLDSRHGRFLRLGPLSFQPSELAKPALVLFLAFFVARRSKAINTRYTVFPAALAVSMLAGAVVVADLGTAAVLVATALVVFWVAGLEKRYFAAALLAGLLAGAGAVVHKPYRLIRLIGFFDPEYKILKLVDPDGWLVRKLSASSAVDTKDPGYHARQSRIAVGSGGLIGLGVTKGRHKLYYVPEAHTDFIYAVVGEETGLLGSSALLLGFMVILWRGLRVCWLARDEFGRYLALGITAAVVGQAFLNMSVVLDLTPTKGIPLPMISQGGSSLLSTLMNLGMLLSVSEHSG